MKSHSTLAVSLVLSVMSANAVAAEETLTAGGLEELCRSSSPSDKLGCRLYILGVAQGIGLGINIAGGKTNGGRPCVPDNISAAALELAVKMKMGQDLTAFPDDRKLEAPGLVGAILVSTFPCRK